MKKDFINVDTTSLYTGLMYSNAAYFLQSLKGKYFKDDIISINVLKEAIKTESFLDELKKYVLKTKNKNKSLGSYYSTDCFLNCIQENITVYEKYSNNIQL